MWVLWVLPFSPGKNTTDKPKQSWIQNASVDVSGIVELDDFIECVRKLLANDQKNLDIFNGLIAGVTQKEIAEAMQISAVAVSKRVMKIRDVIDTIK